MMSAHERPRRTPTGPPGRRGQVTARLASAVVLGAIVAVPGAPAQAAGVSVNDCSALTQRPSRLLLTCDGPPDYVIDGTTYPGSGGELSRVTWTQWGPSQARGTGRLALSTLEDGVYQRLRVTVILDRVRTQAGERVFTRATTQGGPDAERNTWELARWRSG